MPSSAQILFNIKILASLQFWPLNRRYFTQAHCLNMNTQYNTEKHSAGNTPAAAPCVDLRFLQIPDCLKMNIDTTLDRYKVFRRRIYTEPGSGPRLGSVLVLGDELVQVVPIQNLDRNKIARLNTWTDPVPVLVRNKSVVLTAY